VPLGATGAAILSRSAGFVRRNPLKPLRSKDLTGPVTQEVAGSSPVGPVSIWKVARVHPGLSCLQGAV
jgi:hypothetical protein